MMYIHDSQEFLEISRVLAEELGISKFLIEKDYWIMHCLYSLQKSDVSFEIKGGTSLSKGHNLIHRFSEDIDLKILPIDGLPTGKNQTSKSQVARRRKFIDEVAVSIMIPGVTSVERDLDFDDKYMRHGGVRLYYDQKFESLPGVKRGILLEVGFDVTTPNRYCDISSWVMDRVIKFNENEFVDNRAMGVSCYEPGYTFVEKLCAISTKFRQQQESKEMPTNFMRHYYDVFCLINSEEIQRFIGTPEYKDHKSLKFRNSEEMNISNNPAFYVRDLETRRLYEEAYISTAELYYKEFPTFSQILEGIALHIDLL